MTDGRKFDPARSQPRRRRPTWRHRLLPTVAAMTLGLTGVGVVAASPAAADDLDTRIDRAQAEVDRLGERSEERAAAHREARDKAAASKKRVQRLTDRIAEQRELAGTLRTEVAQGVLVEHAAGGGQTAIGADARVSDAAEDFLTGVAVVTEDTDGRTQAMADAEAEAEELADRRSEVRQVLQERRARAERTQERAAAVSRSLDAQQGRLGGLQAERERRDEVAARKAAAAEETAAVASSAVAYAQAQVGKSYVWGGAGPDAFDCSGLTMAAWATQGVSLPHNSGAQYAAGTPVSESELQPGDLVFYYSPISHVGLYVGNGQVVNALNPGSGVQVSGLHDMPFSGAVRPG